MRYHRSPGGCAIRGSTIVFAVRQSLAQRSLGRPVRSLLFLAGGAALAWKVSQAILNNEPETLIWLPLMAVGAAFVFVVMQDWRKGLYCFLFWLAFEDFFRKYLGNSIVMFFGKDLLLVLVYLSFYSQVRRGQAKFFRPPFLVPLLLLVWLGVAQIFNFASPSVLYGLLGFKVYFFYFPLFFIGYSLIDSEAQLQRLLKFVLCLVLVIVSLGIAQSIVGPTFLNPATLAAEIRESSTLYRVAPESGAVLYRPCSVFVSTGRYSNFLMVTWLLVLGTTGYLLLRTRHGRRLAFLSAILVAAGSFLIGARGTLVWAFINAAVTSVAFLWGAPWKQREVIRIFRTLTRVAAGMAFALVLLYLFFPTAIGSRMAFYSETLFPSIGEGELRTRTWEYPIRNLVGAFDDRWPYGYGIGTGSLGAQYVVKYFGVKRLGMSVESGFGSLVLEMGIGGLILWVLAASAIVISAWRVVKRLRGSPWFPLGFAIFWYSFILLFPAMFSGLQPYQDYLLNAYLWLLLGILFRLPSLAQSIQSNEGQTGLRSSADPGALHQAPH